MIRFVGRRLLIIPLALIIVVLLSYAYAHTVQWDYAGRYPQLYTRLKVTQRPESLVEAYRAYWQGLRQFNLGTLTNGEPVAKILRQALGASLGLLGVALALSIPSGLILGILSANWRSLRPARWLPVVSTTGLAMPSFYTGSLLILFSVAYALSRAGNRGLPFPMAGFGWDKHMVFPVVSLMLRPTVQIAQVTGTLLTQELQKPYVAAARSVGHKRATIKRHLAFRNVLAPVLLTIATSMRALVTDLILVEWLFFWPGIGRFLALSLIPAGRTNMASSPYLLHPEFTTALMASVTLLFLIADFVASVLVRVFDPRLRVAVAGEVTNV